MVGADNHHDVGLHVLDDVDGLVDGVGGAEIPMLAETLLRRHRGDVVANSGEKRQTWEIWRSSEWDLYWVSTTT